MIWDLLSKFGFIFAIRAVQGSNKQFFNFFNLLNWFETALTIWHVVGSSVIVVFSGCLVLALLLENDSSAVLQTCHLQILFYGDVAYSLFLELEGIKDSKAVGNVCKSQIIHWCNIKCWWICLQSCFFLFLDFDLMGFPTNFFWQIKKNPLYVTYTNEWFGISNPKDLWNSDSFHFPRIENMPRPQSKEYLRQVCNTAFESVSKRRANTTHHLQIQFYLVSTYISKHSNRILHSCLLDMC